MRGDRKKKVRICVAVAFVVAAVLVCGIFLRSPTATEVFEKSVQSIVELKAYSQEMGENFGTAVCIGDDGIFVTNAHVVTYTRLGTEYQYDEYFLRFAHEEDYPKAELKKFDEEKDIAVLQLIDKTAKTRAIKIGNSDNLRFGARVYAIGNGSNYGLSITCGIVSMPKVNIEYGEKTKEVIQCDLTISSGNSGGALLDQKGRLIGLTTFRTKDSGGDVIYGIVYCLPINQVLSYCDGES